MPPFKPDTLEDLALKAAAAQLDTAGHNASGGRAWTAIESLERTGSILTLHSADLAAVLKRKREMAVVLGMVTSSIRHIISLRKAAVRMARKVRERAQSYTDDHLAEVLVDLEEIGLEFELTAEAAGLGKSVDFLCRQGWVAKEKRDVYHTLAKKADRLAKEFWRIFNEINNLESGDDR